MNTNDSESESVNLPQTENNGLSALSDNDQGASRYAMVASSESVHGERKLGEKILTRCMGKDMRIHFRLIGLEVDLRICRKI